MQRTKIQKRKLRSRKVRVRVRGSESHPRLSVFRSSRHIYAQIINDDTAKTMISMSDILLDEKATKGKNKTEVAYIVGESLGNKAKELGINNVVFDRGGFAYHGRVKAIAEGLRGSGIKL